MDAFHSIKTVQVSKGVHMAGFSWFEIWRRRFSRGTELAREGSARRLRVEALEARLPPGNLLPSTSPTMGQEPTLDDTAPPGQSASPGVLAVQPTTPTTPAPETANPTAAPSSVASPVSQATTPTNQQTVAPGDTIFTAGLLNTPSGRNLATTAPPALPPAGAGVGGGAAGQFQASGGQPASNQGTPPPANPDQGAAAATAALNSTPGTTGQGTSGPLNFLPVLAPNPGGPQVQLAANPFVGSKDSPWAQITVIPGQVGGSITQAVIDVDFTHTGQFDAPQDLNYAVIGTGLTTLPTLPDGTYQIRARVVDSAGNEAISNTVTVHYDSNAGLLGSQALTTLAQESASGTVGKAMTDAPLQIDGEGRVLIQARATPNEPVSDFASQLQGLGMQVVYSNPEANMVTGWLPVNQLANLTNLQRFDAAVPVYKPVLRVGSATDEGDAVIKGDAFRAQTGTDGSGVQVGVLSDSVGQVGGGLADSARTGDLPGNVQVLQDGLAGSTDEGRAMLELIHHVAPGASLSFATATVSPDAFAAAIHALYNNGARVLVDDVGYVNSPLFNVGRIGQAVDGVTAGGAVYVTAAGNDGNNGWQANFDPLNTTVGGVTGTFQNFGGSAQQTFTLGVGQSFGMGFRWSEPYLEGGDPSANFQVHADFAVHVINADTGQIVATYADNNQNTDQAYTRVDFKNDGSLGTTHFALAFQLKSGPMPARVGWVQDYGPALNALDEGASTLYGQTLSPSAITVGATPASNPTQPESFSSQGGNVQLFSDDQGNVLASPQIVSKPDVVGPDGVHTSFFGQADGNRGFLFSGTSAAAANVAGGAALLEQQSPSTPPDGVASNLRSSAKDLLTPGPDASTGAGLVQLTPIDTTGPGGPGGPGSTAGPGLFTLDPNSSSDKATNLGAVGSTGLTLGNQAIGMGIVGLQYDWFKLTAAQAGAFVVGMSNPSLEMHMFTLSAGALAETTEGAPVQAGQVVYVEVKGIEFAPGIATQGTYNLSVAVV